MSIGRRLLKRMGRAGHMDPSCSMITDQIMCANGVRARATLTDAKMWCSAGAGGAKVRSTCVRGREASGARSSDAVPRIPYRADVSRGGSISSHVTAVGVLLRRSDSEVE